MELASISWGGAHNPGRIIKQVKLQDECLTNHVRWNASATDSAQLGGDGSNLDVISRLIRVSTLPNHIGTGFGSARDIAI
jgi:hypothetical protein